MRRFSLVLALALASCSGTSEVPWEGELVVRGIFHEATAGRGGVRIVTEEEMPYDADGGCTFVNLYLRSPAPEGQRDLLQRVVVTAG